MAATPFAAELIATANAIATAGKGILAADESAGTIGKRFETIGARGPGDATAPRVAPRLRARRATAAPPPPPLLRRRGEQRGEPPLLPADAV